MKISECLTLAGQPAQIGGMTPAQIIDASSLNNIFDYEQGRSIPAPGDPVHSKVPGVLEARLAELLAGPRAAKRAIINMEAYGWGDPLWPQTKTVIYRKVRELVAWLKLVQKHKQPTANIVLDLAGPWEMGAMGQYRRPDTEAAWAKMAIHASRLQSAVLPLVDAVGVQSYWVVRWGDVKKDLDGEGVLFGNLARWQMNACAMATLTTKPKVAIFSPSIVSMDESRFPSRALTDEEMGQSAFYLSAMGFSEMVMWGTVEGQNKTEGGWNRYDPKALETTLRYVDADGEFKPDPQWHYLPTPT